MTDADLIDVVWQMREAQKEYFRDRTRVNLDYAEELERVVDDEFERRAKPPGKTLFDLIDEFDAPPTGGRPTHRS